MTKQTVETPEVEILGEEAMTKTEHFFEENGRKITIAIFAIFAVVAAVLGFKALVLDPSKQGAAEALYVAQSRFESATPDYKLALEGDDAGEGFLDVIADHGSTPAGNLARHYAGICYLKLGDKTSALEMLQAYKPSSSAAGQILNAQNVGLQGDIAVDEGRFAEAATLFVKAAEVSDNMLTTPLYFYKAGLAASAAGDKAQAVELFEKVVRLYPMSSEARSAQKSLGQINQ